MTARHRVDFKWAGFKHAYQINPELNKTASGYAAPLRSHRSGIAACACPTHANSDAASKIHQDKCSQYEWRLGFLRRPPAETMPEADTTPRAETSSGTAPANVGAMPTSAAKTTLSGDAHFADDAMADDERRAPTSTGAAFWANSASRGGVNLEKVTTTMNDTANGAKLSRTTTSA